MDKTKPQPVYKKIKDHIITRIKRGEWSAGMKIPSEAELQRHFQTSRMTVNRAVKELSVNGTLIRKQGLGTFVAHRKQQSSFLEITSIADEIRKNYSAYSCEIHLLCEEKASPAIAREMEVQPYSPIFHSILVHKADAIPIQVGDRYINPDIAPDYLDQDFTILTPADYLLKIAPHYTAEHIVEAMIPDAWIRDLLKINESEPCLTLKRKTWVNGAVATFGCFFHPGSRYSLGSRFIPGSTGTMPVS